MGGWGTVSRSRGNAVSKTQMALEAMMRALLSDAGGDPARSGQRRNGQPPSKPAQPAAWAVGKPTVSKCTTCFLAHHSPKCTLCRDGNCLGKVVLLSDPLCPGKDKIHNRDKPKPKAAAKPAAKPAAAPPNGAAKPQQVAPAHDPALAPTPAEPTLAKPLVSIPSKIEKAKAAAEHFVHTTSHPPDPAGDLVMADGTLFPSDKEIRIQNQLDLYAPEGTMPNPEVHAIFLKQLTMAQEENKVSKTVVYSKKIHHDAASAIEGHKKWLLETLVKEEIALEEAEAALAIRKVKLLQMQSDMQEWIAKAEDAILKAGAILNAPAVATAPVHVAQEMGQKLETSKAERAAKLAAHQVEVGRALTMHEIFEYTEKLCKIQTVSALASVSLTVAPPAATAMPIDTATPDAVHDLDLIAACS